MNRALTATTALLFVLTACSQEQAAEDVTEDAGAKGEILGGTISDDMLPLESRASRSPPLAGEEERLAREAAQREAAARAPAPETAGAQSEPDADGNASAGSPEGPPAPAPATNDEGQ